MGKPGNVLPPSPSRAKPDWATFFAHEIDVPEDFLAERDHASAIARATGARALGETMSDPITRQQTRRVTSIRS